MIEETTMSTKSIRSVAAAAALAAGAILVAAAPAADARPPRTTEDQLAQAKIDCQLRDEGQWGRGGGPGYHQCMFSTAASDGRTYWRDTYSPWGERTQVCYRFSIDTAWVCY
jgi:hypothetical protein